MPDSHVFVCMNECKYSRTDMKERVRVSVREGESIVLFIYIHHMHPSDDLLVCTLDTHAHIPADSTTAMFSLILIHTQVNECLHLSENV